MNTQMDQTTPAEARLTEALRTEADKMQPDHDALRLIRARAAVLSDPLVRRRQRHRRVLAGGLAVGLAAATAAVVLTSGVRPVTGPDIDPARSPSMAVPDGTVRPVAPAGDLDGLPGRGRS